jgi:hypothetical protein
MRSCFVPRRYFSMMVQSGRFGGVTYPANTYFLDTDAAGGGDGSIGTPWNTLESARAGIIALFSSFVTSTVTPTLVCTGATADATAVTNTWPTSSTTYYLTIKTPDAHRKVAYDGTHYHYQRSVSGAPALAIGTNSLRMINIQIGNGMASVGAKAYQISSGGGLHLYDGCKFYCAAGGSTAAWPVLIDGIGGTIIIVNSSASGYDNGFVIGYPTGAPAGAQYLLYNNTFIGANASVGEAVYCLGASASATCRVKNTFIHRTVNGISFPGTWGTTQSLTNYVDHNNTDSQFVNLGTGDYSLTSPNANVIDQGTDLSGDSDYAFSTDAGNYTRSGSWDIGMHEYH